MSDFSDHNRTETQPRAASALYSTLLSQIFEGTLTPGTRLPTELELVGIYGVSRAIVRGALQRLKSDKLVVSRQGDGNYVAGLTHADECVLDVVDGVNDFHLLEVRRELERTTTWHAASHAKREELAALDQIHDAFASAADQVDPDLIALRRLDLEFHATIARFSSNPVLSDLVEIFSRSSALIWLEYLPFTPQLRRQLAMSAALEHDLILKAIRLGNRELAGQAMLRHVQTGEQRLARLFGDRPGVETSPPRRARRPDAIPFDHPLERHAYNDLLDQILNGALPGGSRLPREQDLSARYKISRPAIRKVLQSLKEDSLVQSKQGSAHFVVGFSAHDPAILRIPATTQVNSIFEVRMLLECLACAHAAIHADDTTIDRLEDAQSRIAAVATSDNADLLNGRRADIDFHTTIASCSPNPLVKGLIDFFMPSLAPNFSRWSALSNGQKNDLARSTVDDHDIIISAIRTREPDLARLAMQQHFERTTKKYRAFVWIND